MWQGVGAQIYGLYPLFQKRGTCARVPCTVEAFNKIDNLLQLGINRVTAMSWVSPFLEHSVFIVKCDKPGYTRSF